MGLIFAFQTSLSRARYYSAALVFSLALILPARLLAARSEPIQPKAAVSRRLEDSRDQIRRRRKSAKAEILRQAAAEQDPAERAAQLAVLANLKPGSVAPAELAPYLADADAAVRAEAVRLLGMTGGSAAARLLEGVLRRDANAGVRLAAAFWLGGINDRASIEALGDALKQDADANVRASAAQALRRIGGADAQAQLDAAGKDAHPAVRKAARGR